MHNWLPLPIRLLVAVLGVMCFWGSWNAAAPLRDNAAGMLGRWDCNTTLAAPYLWAGISLGLTSSIVFLAVRGIRTWRDWKVAKADQAPTLVS